MQAKGQLDEAIACYKKAIELDPKFATAHSNLGIALKAKGQLDEAIACFKKAIELDPKFAMAHYNLGICADGQGPVGRGHRLLQEGHRTRPEVRRGPLQPGSASWRDQGRFAESLAAYKRGHELGRNSPAGPTPRPIGFARPRREPRWSRSCPRSSRASFSPVTTEERLGLAECLPDQEAEPHRGRPVRRRLRRRPQAGRRPEGRTPLQRRLPRRPGRRRPGRGRGQARRRGTHPPPPSGPRLATRRPGPGAPSNRTGKPADRAAVQQTLRHWQQDTDLAAIRDAAPWQSFRETERKAFTQLWTDVAALDQAGADPGDEGGHEMNESHDPDETKGTGGPPRASQPSRSAISVPSTADSLEVGLAAAFGKNPGPPRSSLGHIRPVLLKEAEGESSLVVKPTSDAMPSQDQAGDRYQLSGEIARGGMGAVLRGRDVDLGRDLAVKVLLEKYANRPDVARRFIEEAQIGGQLQHPGVVPVYDIGRFGDRPFFTMKLVKGQTLAAILGERTDPPPIGRACWASLCRCRRRWRTPTPRASSTAT